MSATPPLPDTLPSFNEMFAHRFFPNEDSDWPALRMGDASHRGDYEVVGIARYKYRRACPRLCHVFPGRYSRAPESPFVDGSAHRAARGGQTGECRAGSRKALADIDANLTVLDMVSFGHSSAQF